MLIITVLLLSAVYFPNEHTYKRTGHSCPAHLENGTGVGLECFCIWKMSKRPAGKGVDELMLFI